MDLSDNEAIVSEAGSPIDGQILNTYRHRRLSMHRNTSQRMYRGRPNQQTYISSDDDSIIEKFQDQQSLLNSQLILRSMPKSLAEKMHVKTKLHHMRLKCTTKMPLLTRLAIQCKGAVRKSFSYIRNFFNAFELWCSTMKKIEGEFGSATGIYFRFFRLLFLLNLMMFVLSTGFIVIPQLLDVIYNGSEQAIPAFQLGDIFTGEGFLQNTILFYGSYTNRTINIANQVSYSMPRGYFYTMIVAYMLVLFILALNMTRSYHVQFIETKGGLKNIFAHKVFCNWDFGIATENAARLKSSATYHEFKELLNEELNPVRRNSFKEKFLTFMLRLASNLLILILWAAIGYALWKLLEVHWNQSDEAGSTGILTAFMINTVIYVVPVLLALIARHEDYKKPRKAFNVILLRTFVLQAVVVGVLAAFWLFQAHKIKNCWETKLGQEMYRLIIFDFVFMLGFFVLEKLLLYLVSRFKRCTALRPEFEIASHTLQLIYNQSIFWLGLMFAPLLSAIVVLKYFILWYFISTIVIKYCKPSTKFWRATHTQTKFLMMAFGSLMVVMAILGGIIATVETSTCGPFRNLDYAYSFVKDEILNLERGSHVWQLLVYLFKPGVVALIIIGIMGFIYYLRAKAIGQEKVVAVLREMINIERKDKKYLLTQIQEFANEASRGGIPMMETSPGKQYKHEEESQTEFQRSEGTTAPHRNDGSTLVTTTDFAIPNIRRSRKLKSNQF